MKKLLFSFIFYCYRIKRPGLRAIIIRFFTKFDNGQMYSSWLRKIFSHYHGVSIGYGSYGACFKIGAFPRGTVIGNYCSLSSEVKKFNANHPANYFTLHPIFYNPVAGFVEKDQLARRNLKIGNDVWIGHNVILLPNVISIGHGSIIGAGSVVTKNISNYEIVAGNPAKLIKMRFEKKIQEKLIQSNWWNLNKNDLVEKKSTYENLTEPHVEK